MTWMSFGEKIFLSSTPTVLLAWHAWSVVLGLWLAWTVVCCDVWLLCFPCRRGGHCPSILSLPAAHPLLRTHQLLPHRQPRGPVCSSGNPAGGCVRKSINPASLTLPRCVAALGRHFQASPWVRCPERCEVAEVPGGEDPAEDLTHPDPMASSTTLCSLLFCCHHGGAQARHCPCLWDCGVADPVLCSCPLLSRQES